MRSTARTAIRARRFGARYAWTIAREAERTGLPVALAFALVQQESGFQNVFGHDPTIYTGAGPVTRAKYLGYRQRRGSHGQGGMQGVGLTQLTWYSFQDQADALGGCWRAKYQCRVGFAHLRDLIREEGLAAGVAFYNGTGPAAQAYSTRVRGLMAVWEQRLR